MWIIDFEASGLSSESYPIEVGITNGIEEYSSLIKPLPDWTHWDESSAKIHNITHNDLIENGKDAQIVAKELNKLLAQQTIYCDAVNFDGFWLDVLFYDVTIKKQFILKDINDLLWDNEDKRKRYLAKKNALLNSSQFTAHRALDDAKVIWLALQQ